MAKSHTTEDPRAQALQTLRLLTAAAEGDTAYRDLYLQRAAALLPAFLSTTQYEQLRAQQATPEQLLTQARRAVARQDWQQVEELTARATAVHHLLDEKHEELALAQAVYEAPDVAFDPFSPGFSGLIDLGGKSPATLHEELLGTLTALVQADPEWSDLYGQRQTYFRDLSLSPELSGQQVTGASAEELQHQVQQAAAKGDLEELHRLARKMREVAAAPKRESSAGETPHARTPQQSAAVARLATPFPAAAIEPARALGFAHVELTPPSPALQHALQDFIDRYAWQPSFPATELATEGSVHLRPLLQKALQGAPEAATLTTDPIVETAAQFSLHPYVTSGGTRYLPLVWDTEFALIEDFPEEGAAQEAELLSLLGLKARRGLSRVELESALRAHGARVLRERLGLDPCMCRLICVPFDVYLRAGRSRGWGRQERWTHIDGYQVMQGGRVRALVGGDVRYGGLLDLCSISPADRREGVVARFAVVHRERFSVR
jgi:hypothetical protein